MSYFSLAQLPFIALFSMIIIIIVCALLRTILNEILIIISVRVNSIRKLNIQQYLIGSQSQKKIHFYSEPKQSKFLAHLALKVNEN